MSKMASHEPFGHLQPKLWAKEGLGVKLIVWLPTTKSQESSSSRCLQKECNRALESSRGELQLWFRPHSNCKPEPGDMSSQSPESLTWDSFGIPPWESREKVPFRCGSCGATQRILYGGRWSLPPNLGRGESSESKAAHGLSQHQMDAEWVLTNLGLVLDAGPCNNIIIPLPSLIPGLLARPSYPPLVLEVGSGPQVPTFHNSTYLDPQVGLTRNLGVHHLVSELKVKLDLLLRSLGWHPRRTTSKHKTPCWRNPSKTE
jgi:hypothetical protein